MQKQVDAERVKLGWFISKKFAFFRRKTLLLRLELFSFWTQCEHSDGMGHMRWQSHPILTLCAPAATSCR